MEPSAKATILAGKYALGRRLGEGGMGSVWAAEHISLRSQVAIKLINPALAAHAGAQLRFLREARAAAALRSPYVVKILDHGIDDGTPYIVMELLEGESLAARIRRLGRLDSVETARLLGNVAHAIGKAHEAGIVHRDLKPDNIFVVKTEDEVVAKVLDFGVAKIIGAGTGPSGLGTRTGAAVGTPYYMSPEQAEGAKRVDFRSDLWALGVTAYECLIGRRPFESDGFSWVLAICSRPLPIPSHAGDVPPGFDEWFARACARDPDSRFASAKEQASELQRICAGWEAPQPPEVVHELVPKVGDHEVGAIDARPRPSVTATTTEALSTPPHVARRQGSVRKWAPYLLGGALGAGALASFLPRENFEGARTAAPGDAASSRAAHPGAGFVAQDPAVASTPILLESSAASEIAVPAPTTMAAISSASPAPLTTGAPLKPASTALPQRPTDLPAPPGVRTPAAPKPSPKPRESGAASSAASPPRAPSIPADAAINLGI